MLKRNVIVITIIIIVLMLKAPIYASLFLKLIF